MNTVYPNDWSEIADHVKQISGWRCIRCGHLDNPYLCGVEYIPRGKYPCDVWCTHPDTVIGLPPTKQRVLTVHHLDGDKSNCRWWNLAPLCQVCHLQIQGKVNMDRVWMFEHTNWFKPYVAGRYAWLRGLPQDRDYVIDNLNDLLDVSKLPANQLVCNCGKYKLINPPSNYQCPICNKEK